MACRSCVGQSLPVRPFELSPRGIPWCHKHRPVLTLAVSSSGGVCASKSGRDGCIAHTVVCDFNGTYLQRMGIDTQVHFGPLPSVLGDVLLAFAFLSCRNLMPRVLSTSQQGACLVRAGPGPLWSSAGWEWTPRWLQIDRPSEMHTFKAMHKRWVAERSFA